MSNTNLSDEILQAFLTGLEAENDFPKPLREKIGEQIKAGKLATGTRLKEIFTEDLPESAPDATN